jgi:hypothetical protein
MRTNKKKLRLNHAAQATLEFAFAFIVVVLILYSCVKALQWLGLVLGTPVQRHHQGLYTWPGATSSFPNYDPVKQLDAADAEANKGMPSLKLIFTGQLLHP